MTRRALLAVAALLVAATVASVAALGGSAASGRQTGNVTVLKDLWLELVGQFQNSPPGVTPVTHTHYGYFSYIRGVPTFRAEPQNEATALFTFFADGTTSPVITNGPFRTLTRVGTITVYRDPATNGDFAKPDSFRDGTLVLVARYRQHVIVNTLTNAVTAYHQDTITMTKPFDTRRGKVQLGVVGERFDEYYNGQVNMPGPPSGYFVGYAASR